MNMSLIKTALHDSYDLDDSDYLDVQQYDAYVIECEAKRQDEIARREAALWLAQADEGELPFWTASGPLNCGSFF